MKELRFLTNLSMFVFLLSCNQPVTETKQDSGKLDKIIQERFASYNTTTSGIKYRIHSEGNGPELDTGDIVEIHYAGSLLDGSEFDNSYKRKKPFSFKIGVGNVIAGWDEAIPLLKIGDKATIFIPSQLAYGEKEQPGIPAKSDLVFEVEPLKKFPTPIPFDSTGFNKQVTPSGLAYYLIKKTRNKNIQLGDTIKVHFTGYLPNGDIFDSSIQKDEPLEFIYKKNSVIEGWMEVLSILKIGEKAILIVPPHLAYGSDGYGIIPKKATLTFDIELVVEKK